MKLPYKISVEKPTGKPDTNWFWDMFKPSHPEERIAKAKELAKEK